MSDETDGCRKYKTHTHAHTLIHTYIDTYIHVYMNTCMRICLYIYKSKFLHTDIMDRKLKITLKYIPTYATYTGNSKN